jgi:hypothetical protein
MKPRGLLLTLLGFAVLANGALIVDVVVGGGWLPFAEAAASKTESAPAKSDHRGGRESKKDKAEPVTAPGEAAEAQAKEAEKAYRELIQELTDQKAALDKKAKEIAERERQLGVLRQELAAQQATAAPAAGAGGGAAKAGQGPQSDSFKKTVKAFAGMDAENAAKALAELYTRDRDTALDLMLALPARKAAAVMDALAAQKPAMAADLSSEMSHRDEPRAQ